VELIGTGKLKESDYEGRLSGYSAQRCEALSCVPGKGHLACISFAGGRAFPRRKNLFSDDDRVKNNVQCLSHYKKNREAADNSPPALVAGEDSSHLMSM